MHSARPARRLVIVLAAAVLVTMALTLASPAPARAAAYQYWGYFHGSAKSGSGADGWTFATTGADAYKPADGAVEGWRFAIADTSATRYPRTASDFDAVCGDTPAVSGKKRVAVYVDPGLPDEAPADSTPPEPSAVCAVLATSGTGADALAAAGAVRTSKGLICGVGGYPASGCGGAVKNPPTLPKSEPTVTFAIAGATPSASASPSASPTDSGSPTATPAAQPDTSTANSSGSHTLAYVLIAIAVIVAAAVGFFLARRRPT